MEHSMSIIITILLSILLILQIIVLVNLLYDMIKRRKEDKEFYDELNQINQEMTNAVKEVIKNHHNKKPQLEEENKSEQTKPDKNIQ